VTLDWRRPLIYTHRWLGIAGGILFIVWFVSGIVMMYARMPEITVGERLSRLPPLSVDQILVAVADAARHTAACGPGGRPCERVQIGMLGSRPVYRIQSRGAWTTVFADTGQPLRQLTQDQAIDLAMLFAPAHAPTIRYDARIDGPDQWTLSGDALRAMPLHRLKLGDADETIIYISDKTGDVVMKTTGTGRRWGYAGAVLHWLYFTPLRKHGPLWTQVIIWTSLAGCVTCLTGLVWGVFRFSPSARFRLKHDQSHTPYAGLMRWHHYAGLIVGLASFTWVFSGLLSMDPIPSIPGTSPTRQQREAFSGGALRLDAITTDRIRTAAAAHESTAHSPRELEIAQFRGEPFLIARGAPVRFDRDTMLAAARDAMPGAVVADVRWLEEYDSYYYDRGRALSLPVLRVRYADPNATWLYLDPRRGAIVRKEERLTRLNRWLYHGLHSLDFPFLYYRRPLWDIVVIVLSLGGIVLSATTFAPGFHRVKRNLRAW
jgi:hypothetical protein